MASASKRDEVNTGKTDGESRNISQLAQGIRFDLIIAICALLASSLATVASFWQTHVIEEQLSAQTWPYIQFVSTDSPQSVKLTLDNPGLGPAVLRTLTVSVDKKPLTHVIDVLHALIGPKIRAQITKNDGFRLQNLNPDPGYVIRAGDSVVFFELTSKRFAPILAKNLTRLSLSACYCAILSGSCWSIDAEAPEPKPLNGCPPVTNNWLGNSNETTSREF